MKRNILVCTLALVGLFLQACGGDKPAETTSTTEENKPQEEQVVNVYTHRHYDTDKALFEQFEKETGIKVNVVKAKADELISRLESEGELSEADVLITVDAGRLYRAKDKGLLQSVSSEMLEARIPAHLRDEDNQWFGLTQRGRVVVYAKDRVKPEMLSSYEDLADAKWKGRLLVRSSENIYNQSLMAAMIERMGKEKAQAWAKAVVGNMARRPSGNDRDQVKAIAQGLGDIAIVNTYYIGKLLNSDDEAEREAGEAVKVFFPSLAGQGTHMNVSGIGVTKHAPHVESAVRFIEFLTSKEAQAAFANSNFEYPINPEVAPAELLQSWGEFQADSISLNVLGARNAEAVEVFQQADWK